MNATKKDFELGEKETVASVFVFHMSGEFPCRLSVYSEQISEYEDSDYKLARFVSNKLGADCLANNLKSQATDFLRFDKDGNYTLVYADEDILDDEDRIVVIESY